jgi:hypothetical protein
MGEIMTVNPRYAILNTDYASEMLSISAEDDGPIWMVNLMKYREIADYEDGRESTITGKEADNLYAPIEVLSEIGAEIVFIGDVETQLLGDDPKWDRVAVVKYPTRRSFVEMSSRKDFQEKYVHKEAGMQKTIVMGCIPMDNPTYSRKDWTEVENPPSESDGSITVVHVLQLNEQIEKMDNYSSIAGESAIPNGVHIDGWFQVENTILGDERKWNQVRFNTFPSRKAFQEVLNNPARIEAQKKYRETAISDTYTMIVTPSMNKVFDSI